MNRLLIIGSFPAPYRIAVFKGLCKKYETDIFFVTSDDEKRDTRFFVKATEVPYHLLNEREGKEFFFDKLKKIKQYKAVIAYDWYLPYAMLAELVALLFGIPYVINCDGALRKSYQDFKIKDIIKRFYISNARYCFASGKHAEDYFLHYGAKKARIIRHNFSSLSSRDIVKCLPSEKEKLQYRNKLGFGNRKVVLSVGQFIYRKGFDLLLKAWKKLDCEYTLIIIGGGPERENYEQYIKMNNLRNVSLLEYIPHDEVLLYMKAADLFVLPTREDVWGLVVNEAMAVGLPIITSDQCVAGDELLSSECICPIEEFSEKLPFMIKKLFESPIMLKDIREENLETIKKYTYDDIVKSHISSLEKL